MPYWRKYEVQVDVNNKIIAVGDILEHTDPDNIEKYFACSDDGEYIEVRDLNNNNVCMCELGLNGNVKNIGHYTNNLDKLDDDDLAYYFGVNRDGTPNTEYRWYKKI